MKQLAFVSNLSLWSLVLVVTTVSGLSTQSVAQEEKPKRTFEVKQGNFEPLCQEKGRVSSVTRVHVLVAPEEFNGSLIISEVVRSGGRVTQGDVILRLDSKELERVVRDAREVAENTRNRLNLLKDQQRLLGDEHKSRLGRAQKSHEEATADLESFERHDSPQMIAASELTVEQRRANLQRRREELKELTETYDNPDISPERRETVLARARRNVSMAEKLMSMAESELEAITKIREPQRKSQLQAQVSLAAERVTRMRERQRIAEALQQEEISEVERALRNHDERVERLQRDRERLTVKATHSGMLAPIDLQPRELITPRNPISEIYDPSNLTVLAEVPAPSLRFLEVGKTVKLVLLAYPDVDLSGKVSAIADLGIESPDETRYPVVVSITGKHRLLRIGLRCELVASGETLPNAIAIPESALRGRRDAPNVEIWKDGRVQRRRVVVGMRNRTHAQILEGLAPGDEVVLPPQS